jgi:hypothetical protein
MKEFTPTTNWEIAVYDSLKKHRTDLSESRILEIVSHAERVKRVICFWIERLPEWWQLDDDAWAYGFPGERILGQIDLPDGMEDSQRPWKEAQLDMRLGNEINDWRKNAITVVHPASGVH